MKLTKYTWAYYFLFLKKIYINHFYVKMYFIFILKSYHFSKKIKIDNILAKSGDYHFFFFKQYHFVLKSLHCLVWVNKRD